MRVLNSALKRVPYSLSRRRTLYGLKSAGAAFRALLAETLYDLGYVPTMADPDVWLRPAVKVDGFEYYEMVLCYVDDILSISENPKATLEGLQGTFKLKDNKIEEPDMYLGGQLGKMQVDGVECWTVSAEKYVSASVKNVEDPGEKGSATTIKMLFTVT